MHRLKQPFRESFSVVAQLTLRTQMHNALHTSLSTCALQHARRITFVTVNRLCDTMLPSMRLCCLTLGCSCRLGQGKECLKQPAEAQQLLVWPGKTKHNKTALHHTYLCVVHDLNSCKHPHHNGSSTEGKMEHAIVALPYAHLHVAGGVCGECLPERASQSLRANAAKRPQPGAVPRASSIHRQP